MNHFKMGWILFNSSCEIYHQLISIYISYFQIKIEVTKRDYFLAKLEEHKYILPQLSQKLYLGT